ncbi:MAG TPA: WD40 repeat domain-containing protein [Phototrophicaceae bacterium]|nr:WD40 repeat domain-containing protein [Phototrophicaceae bacterium]
MQKFLLLGLILLAACVPTISTPEATGFVVPPREGPTATPVPWAEGQETIALANVTRITRLGRLDPVNALSTVFAYAFSPDDTRLAGINNTNVMAWDLLTGEQVFSTDRADALTVYYAPDKTEIYTVDVDGLLRIHDADQGNLKTDLPGHEQYSGVSAYDAASGWLALGGLDGNVKIWDVAARQALATIAAHDMQVTALAFSPDGHWLASGGQEGVVKIWDWRQRVSQAELEAAALRLTFSPAGDQLAVGEPTRSTLWTAPEGKKFETLETGPGGVRDVLRYAPDGRYLLNGGGIPSLTLWNPQTGDYVASLPDTGGDNVSAAFSSDGALLITSALGVPLSLWNLTEIQGDVLTRANLDFGVKEAVAVDWTPDGFLLALFEAAGPVQIWGIPPAATGGG